MASERDDLSPEEVKLKKIEKKVNMNRLVLSIIAILILVSISVSLTIGILKALQQDVQYAPYPQFKKQQELVSKLNDQITSLQITVDQHEKQLLLSSNDQLRLSLLKQEQENELFLVDLKDGFHDLAKMIHGSRTWLSIYNEKLQQAISRSQQRQLLLAPQPDEQQGQP